MEIQAAARPLVLAGRYLKIADPHGFEFCIKNPRAQSALGLKSPAWLAWSVHGNVLLNNPWNPFPVWRCVYSLKKFQEKKPAEAEIDVGKGLQGNIAW